MTPTRIADWNQNARETVAAASLGVDERTGIIKHISVQMIEPDEPRLFHAVTTATNTERLYGYAERASVTASCGAGLTMELALASAIGESLERYCSAIYDERQLIFSSHNDLRQQGLKAIAGNQLALYSDSQYRRPGFIHHRFTDDREITWTYGYSLSHEQWILVPACLVYVPYRYTHPGDLIAFGVSTGLCCRRSLADAILGGLYEVVERDAIMCMWMNRIPFPTVNLDSGVWLPSTLNDQFSPSGIRFHLNDITTDLGIPAFFGLLIDEHNDGLAVAVGASSNLDQEAAALKALMEAAQVRRWLKVMKQDAPRSCCADFSDVISFEDHVRLFGSLNSIAYVEFLLNSPEVRSFSSVHPHVATNSEQDLERCVHALTAKGFDVIIVDVTQPDVAELGFHVVKVIVPGLIDINSDHNYPLLGGKRLYTVPRSLGFVEHEVQELDFNGIPHPFP